MSIHHKGVTYIYSEHYVHSSKGVFANQNISVHNSRIRESIDWKNQRYPFRRLRKICGFYGIQFTSVILMRSLVLVSIQWTENSLNKWCRRFILLSSVISEQIFRVIWRVGFRRAHAAYEWSILSWLTEAKLGLWCVGVIPCLISYTVSNWYKMQHTYDKNVHEEHYLLKNRTCSWGSQVQP